MKPDNPRRPYYRHDQDPPGERWCPRCEQLKPIADFTLPGGRVQGHCRPCRLAVTQEYRRRNRDRLLARRRATYRPTTMRRRWLKPLSVEGEAR